MKNKIYITGCAKSGTTLVRRLFNAFENLKVYNYDEITPTNFVNTDYDVGKRYGAVFSGWMPPNQIESQLKMFNKNNIKIIDVVRNKEDVLKSDKGYVSSNRYEACMAQREQYGSSITYTIVYEDLISNPDKVQLEISKLLELNIKYKWSDYPSFIDISQENPAIREGLYELRPIGAPKNIRT